MTNESIRVRWAALLCAAALAGACTGTAKPPKMDPQAQATSHYRMAQAGVRNGKINDAIAEMQKAIALQPKNADFVNFHGQLLFLAGRLPQAESQFRSALELDTYLTDAHNNLGAVLDRMGKKPEAEAEYRRALEDPAYPSPEKVYLNLGLLYGSQGRDDAAIRELRKAVEIAPKYYRAHFELASRLEAGGKFVEAASEYEVAGPDYVTSADYHYRLGFTYLRLDNKLKAADHLKRVIALSPGSENAAKAQDLLAMVK